MIARIVAVALAAFSSACAASAVAPTPVTETRPVLVVVLERFTEAPVPHAFVRVDNAAPVRVGPDGSVSIAVPARIETCLRASADGFVSFAACGTVEGYSERWRFYLERQP